MIATYEQTFDQENTETTDGVVASVRREAYCLAVASFICNLVCTAIITGSHRSQLAHCLPNPCSWIWAGLIFS